MASLDLTESTFMQNCKQDCIEGGSYTLEDVVVELVVAGEGDKAAPAAGHGEEHLDGSISPYLQVQNKSSIIRNQS